MPADATSVRFVVLSLNRTAEHAAAIAANRRHLDLEVFRSINGFDKRETVSALLASKLKYHLYSYCGFTRFGTYGSLANYVTKYFALAHQVAHEWPYMAMLEDDMRLEPGFREYVEAAVRTNFEQLGWGPRARPELLVLGSWGEGYVTSLASARRVLRSLRQQGVPQNVDIMLNEGHVGRAVRLRDVPWTHRVGPNLGDCLKTPHIGMTELPRAVLATGPKCGGTKLCLSWVRKQRARYCRGRPAAPAGRRHGGRRPDAAGRMLSVRRSPSHARKEGARQAASEWTESNHDQRAAAASASFAFAGCPLTRGRVAVLLRGQAFRGARHVAAAGPSALSGCSGWADVDGQRGATHSLLEHIVRPLERAPCANTVRGL